MKRVDQPRQGNIAFLPEVGGRAPPHRLLLRFLDRFALRIYDNSGGTQQRKILFCQIGAGFRIAVEPAHARLEFGAKPEWKLISDFVANPRDRSLSKSGNQAWMGRQLRWKLSVCKYEALRVKNEPGGRGRPQR